MAGPLSHIRVLDISRVLAGPWAGQNLADLGAEVIKVERPGSGDDSRAFGPPWGKDKDGRDPQDSAYYTSANRGKKSITVDISRPEGQKLVRELARISDVLVENYKFGDLARYRLSYDDLAKINPRLVYCSVTGFGQTGPYRERPGYDFMIQGMGGMMSVTGEPDDAPGGGPQRAGVPVADIITGMYASIAICAALAQRVESRSEMTRLLSQVFAQRTTREWVELLDAAGVANGPINDVAQVFEEPQVKARGVKIELEHALAGKLPLVASPMRFSGTPLEHRLAPPVLGQHTEEILREVLRLSDGEIARLRADGVI